MKCKYCDSEISEKALVCPHCQRALITKGNKSKALAVILAHLLGTFTWLYTWKIDQGKWALVTFGGIFTGIVALLFLTPKELTPENNIASANIMLVIWVASYIIGSIWAVILAWSRPGEWYRFYFLNIKKKTKGNKGDVSKRDT